ncbi:MAG: multiple antibiotic resistance (MarC)-related protein [Xanthobacteraceae bacterium]|nr:multiple antibiotic resistance (MarC)-related protein [Xanthobacteraceae bacterium]
MNWSERLAEFVTLWVVIDPLGTLPVFLAVTSGVEEHTRRRAALLAVLISFGVLVFFVFAGHWLLRSMDVSINSFQIAGGIVLFLFALTMIHGNIHPEIHPLSERPLDLAVHPLAIPSIASPGAMLAAVVLTDDAGADLSGRLVTVAIFALVLVLTLLILLAAGPISRIIGRGGSSIISRVMGMILAALAVDLVLTAVSQWLSLPPI